MKNLSFDLKFIRVMTTYCMMKFWDYDEHFCVMAIDYFNQNQPLWIAFISKRNDHHLDESSPTRLGYLDVTAILSWGWL